MHAGTILERLEEHGCGHYHPNEDENGDQHRNTLLMEK